MYVNTLISLQENISTYGIDGRKVTGHVTICSPGIIKCYVQNLRRSGLNGKQLCLYVFSSKHTSGLKLGALSDQKESKWTVDCRSVMGSGMGIDQIDGVAVVAEGEDINSTDTILLGYENSRYMIFPILEELLPAKRKYAEVNKQNMPDIVSTSPAASGKKPESVKVIVKTPVVQQEEEEIPVEVTGPVCIEEPEKVEVVIKEEPEEVIEEVEGGFEEKPEEVIEEILEEDIEEVIEEEPEEIVIEDESGNVDASLICKNKKTGKCSTIICTPKENVEKKQTSKCNKKCSGTERQEEMSNKKIWCECEVENSSAMPQEPGMMEQEPGPVTEIDGEPVEDTDEEIQEEQENNNQNISQKPVTPATNTVASSGIPYASSGIPDASVVTNRRNKPMVQKEVEESYLSRQRQLRIEEEIKVIKERLCNLENQSAESQEAGRSTGTSYENHEPERDKISDVQMCSNQAQQKNQEEEIEEINYLQEIERKLKDIKEKLRKSNVLEKTMRNYVQGEEDVPVHMKGEEKMPDKGTALKLIYDMGESLTTMQNREGIDWVKIPYAEFLKIPSLSYEWCTQPFVTFSFYKYNEILLGRSKKDNKYYVGIPDIYHPNRKNILDTNNKVQGFLCKQKMKAEIGEYGYWVIEV